jgi:hypothetical protein
MQGASAADAQRRRLEQAVSAISGIPELELQKYTPEQLISMGNFTPEELQAIGLLGPSAYENIQLDPRLRADQEMALSQARERALRGFTAEDAAMLDQYMRQAASTAQSATQNALNDMSRRGMGGSGAALAAALQGTQSAANLQSQQAMQQAAMRLQAQDRNTDALARLAASMEGTDYSRAADLANRRDTIQQFNQQLRQRIADTNVQNRNLAAERNLNLAQRLSDANIGIRNEAQLKEWDRRKMISDDRYRKAAALSGAIQNEAKAVGEMNQNRAQGWANIAGAIGGLAGNKDFSSWFGGLFGSGRSGSVGAGNLGGPAGIGPVMLPSID